MWMSLTFIIFLSIRRYGAGSSRDEGLCRGRSLVFLCHRIFCFVWSRSVPRKLESDTGCVCPAIFDLSAFIPVSLVSFVSAIPTFFSFTYFYMLFTCFYILLHAFTYFYMFFTCLFMLFTCFYILLHAFYMRLHTFTCLLVWLDELLHNWWPFQWLIVKI